MIPKKPAPDMIRGGNRFSEKIARKARCTDKSQRRIKRVPARHTVPKAAAKRIFREVRASLTYSS